MKISLIAAMTPGGFIGGPDGGIPWHMPRDVRHFRAHTAGKRMLVGRRTYEEMIGWFKELPPIVLTRRPHYSPGKAILACNVPEALSMSLRLGASHLVVLGGGSVFSAALPLATELILTVIHTDARIEGGAKFPAFREDRFWRCTRTQSFPADAENPHAMDIEWWSRRPADGETSPRVS